MKESLFHYILSRTFYVTLIYKAVIRHSIHNIYTLKQSTQYSLFRKVLLTKYVTTSLTFRYSSTK